MTLRADAESASRARRWFRKLTSGYGMGCSVDDCVLLLSELVTNAVLHGDDSGDGTIRVEWWRIGEQLQVDVDGPGRPERIRTRRPGPHEEGGRGLLLVDTLADSWTVSRTPRGGALVSFTVTGAWMPGAPTRPCGPGRHE